MTLNFSIREFLEPRCLLNNRFAALCPPDHICIDCSFEEEFEKSAGDVANTIIGTEEDKLGGPLFRAVLDVLCCGKHAGRHIS